MNDQAKDQALLEALSQGRMERMKARRGRVALKMNADKDTLMPSAISNTGFTTSSDENEMGKVGEIPLLALNKALGLAHSKMEASSQKANAFVRDLYIETSANEVERRRIIPKLTPLAVEITEPAIGTLVEDIEKLDAYAVYEKLKERQKVFTALLASKNEHISKLQAEIIAQDNQYSDEMAREATQIHLILADLNGAVDEYRRLVRAETDQLERAWLADRKQLLQKTLQSYEGYLSKMASKQFAYYGQHPERVAAHLSEFDMTITNETVEEKQLKAKLEQDIHVLTLKLEEMKATFLFNSEKLEFNYQVLKRRDEENGAIMTVQKRKINRLNDVVSALRFKISKQRGSAEKEVKSTAEDYGRMQVQWKEFNQKFERFQRKDQKLYKEVAQMYTDDILQAAKDVIKADRVICETVLGTEWQCPDEWNVIIESTNGDQLENSLESKAVFSRDEWIAKLNDENERSFLLALESQVGELLFDFPPEEDDVPQRMERVLKAIGIRNQTLYTTLKSFSLNAENQVSEVKLLESILELNSKYKSQNDFATVPLWNVAMNAIKDPQIQQWDMIYPAMTDYFKALQRRNDLQTDIAGLSKENGELKVLINSFMASKDHDELQIPPEMTRQPKN
eukprot:Partr_v1_DN27128_c0_g1_i1_m15725 putative coiled-coil domain containing 164